MGPHFGVIAAIDLVRAEVFSDGLDIRAERLRVLFGVCPYEGSASSISSEVFLGRPRLDFLVRDRV
jgi:hypothetical protein